MDLKQVAVDRYGSRDELVQRGVWRGELYRYADTDKGRGWLWKALIAEEQPNNGNQFDKRHQMHVRRLTPPAVPKLTAPLEKPVIELDLRRLNDAELLQPEVQKTLLELMIRVLTMHNWTYKQGFHELLGTIWLQLREPNSTMTVFEKMMEQVVPIFYNETRLAQWEKHIFAPLLKVCSPILHDQLYREGNHTNLLWLLRWTRVLFLRELPMDYVLVIWDHILTGTYPIETLLSGIIVVLLLNVYGELSHPECDDDDLVEILLNYNESVSSLVDSAELCRMGSRLVELWFLQDVNSLRMICNTFLKLRFNVNQVDNNNS
ncbi:hypothetical protein ZYGR_0I04560 [Zygosaccharomyces rouxii]|uniref:Rab-GAP TBC domain-containing protein n=1 Tax=Zygosaccharomyces rouxii TaxID=4956 RepID=A0A1Q2ZXJ0_ZYGRO|nr:hypothetical protein ZYGR_0I04560 [Zygosaccharomyces rouxii]